MSAAALADLGHTRTGAAALIVETPGMPPEAYALLARTLERHGLDAWALSFPVAAQDPAAIIATEIPEALASVRASGRGGRKVALVGHGLGGRLAAEAVATGTAVPDALALLGAPLDLAAQVTGPLALVGWLANLPLPEGDLDLNAVASVSWNGSPALPLLLGTPLPTFVPVSRAWLASLADEVEPGHAVSLAGAPCPVWEGASPSDNLAPPETARDSLGGGTFVRFGYLHLDSREPDHLGLLSEPLPGRTLASWLAQTLRKSQALR